ncbi:DUF4105 domain-containing protein [Bacteriovorax sp. DB6_IX]|uniref:lipoprotein N-acyltransferase Lnb domain-containing protein n=1 Tax=Bacteriovorax sp. DB6_IX TaxID=1353530 RepID=UPI0012FBD956|nr:DUF4105 domain-containing protein [Bacteriovorax sp. DB6_IX]
MRTLILCLLFLSALTSHATSPATGYLGIISEGPGAGMFGHAFIAFSKNYQVNSSMEILEYNLEINTLSKEKLDKMSLMEKVSSFFNGPYKVYTHDFHQYLVKYINRGQTISFYKINANSEQILRIYKSIFEDKKERNLHEKNDYNIFTNNCITELITTIQQDLRIQAELPSVRPLYYKEHDKELKYLSLKKIIDSAMDIYTLTETGDDPADLVAKKCGLKLESYLNQKTKVEIILDKIHNTQDCIKDDDFSEYYFQMMMNNMPSTSRAEDFFEQTN